MFFSRKEYSSDKNGTIVVSKFFLDAPSILVGTCLQSGSYIKAMWKKVFSELPKSFAPYKILLLGLAGGNVIALLQKKYPDAHITVVEWDEVMIEIAHKLQLFLYNKNLHVLHADAFSFIKGRNELFDFIIIDLFTGEVPPKELTENRTLSSLEKILTCSGCVLVNFFRHEQYQLSFREHFLEKKSFEIKVNHLALYMHKNN